MAKYSVIQGRYIYLDVEGIEYRVYFEEAGSGIPLVCQHTAGSDGRQYRHLLEDPAITSRFRVIACRITVSRYRRTRYATGSSSTSCVKTGL